MTQRIFLLFNSIENILLIAYNIVVALIFTQLAAICTPSSKNRPTTESSVKPGRPTAASSPATFRSKETMSREEPSNELAQSPLPKKDKVAEKTGGGAKKARELSKKKASEKGKSKSKKAKNDGLVGGGEGEGADGADGAEGDQYDEDGNVRHEKTIRIEMNDDQTKSDTKSLSIAESIKKKKKDKTTVTKEGSIHMDAVAKKSENKSDNKKSVTVEVSKNCSVTFEGSPANI